MKHSATDSDAAIDDEKCANELLRENEILMHLQLIRSAEANLAAAKRRVNHYMGAESCEGHAAIVAPRQLH